MNEKELAEIEARVQALFKGEWVEETDENGDEWIRIPGGHDVKFWNIEGSSGCCYAVTHFITHAREDVPALVAEVRRLTNLVEALEFLTEDETGMLSDAPLTPDKLVEILRLLKDQRDYAAETAEMHAKIVEQLRNEYNLFRYTAKTEIERLRAALEASEKVCKIISEYMSSGDFFDPETSKAIYEWQALKGGEQ